MKYRSKKSLRTLRRKNVASVKKRRYTRKRGGNNDEVWEQAENAVIGHDLATLEDLLENGFDINYQNQYGYTLLMIAASNGDFVLINFLLENGADVSKQNDLKQTALIQSMTYSFYDREQFPNTKDIVELLVQHGANPEAEDRVGCTALFYAIRIYNREIILFLLNNGANINHLSKSNQSPLIDLFSHNGIYDLVGIPSGIQQLLDIETLLLENGADVNIQDKNGDTALMHIIDKNIKRPQNIDIVRLLLEYGADPNLVNDEGKKAIDIARKLRLNNIVDLLKDKIPNIPQNITNRRVLPNNATNAITYGEINFTQPAFNFGKEFTYGRYYQNEPTIEELKRTLKNPFTQEHINVRSATWYMPTRKNKNNTKKNSKNARKN